MNYQTQKNTSSSRFSKHEDDYDVLDLKINTDKKEPDNTKYDQFMNYLEHIEDEFKPKINDSSTREKMIELEIERDEQTANLERVK